ncbi:MAG: hypothetical protein LBF59_04075 [Prevotellaceae bacterium]|nr:hypothetical protein [Prevotellaceae bacterium]
MTKKKKKKVQPATQRKVVTGKHSTTYLNACYAMARRILQSLGEDDSTFDIFTKRQKQDIFRIVILPPRIVAAQGHKVPKQYIRHIQERLIIDMRRMYFDEELGITWMDMATVGLSLLSMFTAKDFTDNLPSLQQETAKRLRKVFETKDVFFKLQEFIIQKIKLTSIVLSQPNFRIYGQQVSDIPLPTGPTSCFQQVVPITAHECQTLRFKYRNIERTAYRIAMGQCQSQPCTGATIEISKILPNVEHDRILNIYIQSHAIHRFKERIDTLFPILRNEFFVLSLMLIQRIVRAPNGMQLIACVMPIKGEIKTIGYFAFTIEGENLLVLTLLPLLSNAVPEGRILYDRLHLSNEDLKYLGMDKLSFFYEVDIEQIPALKRVLYDELHLEYIRSIENSFREKDEPFNEKKTLFVKNFFQKLEEQTFNNDNDDNDNEQYTENINILEY